MMMFMYASVGSTRMFIENIHNMHSSMTVVFAQLYNIECCGAIIDNKSYSPICVLEVKNITIKTTLKNVLRKLFEGICIVDHEFKVTEN